MALITVKEYARMHGRTPQTISKKCLHGGFKTAVKMGRDWFIDSEEPMLDNRIKSGSYIDFRKRKSQE